MKMVIQFGRLTALNRVIISTFTFRERVREMEGRSPEVTRRVTNRIARTAI